MEVKSDEGTVVVMDRLCQMEHQQSNCCCEIKSLVRESEKTD